jgi:hypothetical protein
MYRHIRNSCKAAAAPQLAPPAAAPQPAPPDTAVAIRELAEEIAKLKAQLADTSTKPQTPNQTAMPMWSSDKFITISPEMIRAAFAGNSQLIEYVDFSDEEKTDPDASTPYVVAILIELIRRAHAEPSARNIYLNPRRADQVLVCEAEGWKVLTLMEATRALVESVAGQFRAILMKDHRREELDTSIQNAAHIMLMLYRENPAKYVKESRQMISAHLANNVPRPAK